MAVTDNTENIVATKTSAAERLSTKQSSTDQQFDLLCQQYYQAWFRFHPEKAVAAGVYDHADKLTSYEHDDIGALIVLNQKMQSALDEVNTKELNESHQYDMAIIKGAISIELHDLEVNDWRYRNPIEYVPLNAVYQLLIHPGEKVHHAIKHRLESIPEYLRGAKVMLSRYPERVVPEWTLTASEMSTSGSVFIRGLARHPLITAKFTNPSRLQPLFDAAAAALNDFAHFLEVETLPKAQGKFASGVNRFNRLLKEKHFLDTDADSILAYGEQLVAETEAALLQQSEEICGEAVIATVLAKVQQKQPPASKLLDTYRQTMQSAHAWLKKADIVSLPEQQSLKVLQTPAFLRDVIPFAAYEPPAPLDAEQRGLYYVTTVDDKALLAEHNLFSIDLTSVHEAFPGHHLQFVIASQKNKNNVTRLLNDSATLYEGWALYCEQLVCEQGLYSKKEHQFILLRDRLWRALRIIIDVKIHTGQYSFDDAVNLLVEKLGFDISQAKAEVSWYSNAAATPLCYAVGRELILKAREQVVKDATDKPALKAFHDKLLSQGSIALPLVLQSVFGDDVWQSVRDEVFSKD